MASILQSLQKTVIAGFALLIALFIVIGIAKGFPEAGKEWWTQLFRWLHVLSAIMWIGLLYYFNFVQIPSMPKIPDEQKPAIGKVIAPAALFWFRWAAIATLVTGLIVALLSGYLLNALTLGLVADAVTGKATIGIGMWLGIIMAYNVWMIIWPNQQRALGMVETTPELKAKSARMAMLTSRVNTMLSIPMLFCMIAGAHGLMRL